MKESWTDMFIGCTGKVAKYLHSNLAEGVSVEEPFFCWQVTRFNVMGDEILLFMNIKTRFPLFMRDIEEITIASLPQRFTYLFSQVMHRIHIPKEAVDIYLHQQHWIYGKILDRSVMSQMNDLAYIYKFNMMNGNHRNDHDAEISVNYADIPCIKANMYPKEKMREAMLHLSSCEEKVS